MNECLYKSPQLAPLVFDILIRFRAKVIAPTADIEKAFHQISMDNDDRDYLRFLWLDNVSSDQPTITKNRFARVIFGVTSSPFCLNSTIRKRLIVINEIRQISRKKLDFAKFRKLQEAIWLTVINEIFKFPPHFDPFGYVNYLYELSLG